MVGYRTVTICLSTHISFTSFILSGVTSVLARDLRFNALYRLV